MRWLEQKDLFLQQQEKQIETNGLGFHIPGKFDKVLDINHCYLQKDPSNSIRLAIRDYAITHKIPFYNIRNHEGTLRNLIIRTSSTGQLMVIVVFTQKSEETMHLMEFIAEKFPEITSLQYVINQKVNESITDLEIILYEGESNCNVPITITSYGIPAKSYVGKVYPNPANSKVTIDFGVKEKIEIYPFL